VPAIFHAVLPENDDSPHFFCRNLQTIFLSRLRSAIFEKCGEFLILLKHLHSLGFFKSAVTAYWLLMIFKLICVWINEIGFAKPDKK
jgi:hypothetical protein